MGVSDFLLVNIIKRCPVYLVVKKGHPRVTIIIPIRHISESESLFSRGSIECLGGSIYFSSTAMGKLGGSWWFSGALGGSPGTNGGQFY